MPNTIVLRKFATLLLFDTKQMEYKTMRQIVEKVVTYTGDYKTIHKDGSTNWAAASLWINDETGLMPAVAVRFWMDADKLEDFIAKFGEESETFEKGLIWGRNTKLAAAWQQLVDANGPVRYATINFDEEMVLIKHTESGIDAVEKDGMPVLSTTARYAYFENAILAGSKDSQEYRERQSWIPSREVLSWGFANHSEKPVEEKPATEEADVQYQQNTTAVKSG